MSEGQGSVELSEEMLREARMGFLRHLYRCGFQQHFVANEAEDAFAQAELELLVVLDRGERIFNPVGWLFNCAWHRVLNRAGRERRSPIVSVPNEVLEGSSDERMGVLEEVLQKEERAAVRRAVRSLTEQEQTVVQLLFYEELSIRGAARRLGWASSKVQRRKESSQRKLGKLISRD